MRSDPRVQHDRTIADELDCLREAADAHRTTLIGDVQPSAFAPAGQGNAALGAGQGVAAVLAEVLARHQSFDLGAEDTVQFVVRVAYASLQLDPAGAAASPLLLKLVKYRAAPVDIGARAPESGSHTPRARWLPRRPGRRYPANRG